MGFSKSIAKGGGSGTATASSTATAATITTINSSSGEEEDADDYDWEDDIISVSDIVNFHVDLNFAWEKKLLIRAWYMALGLAAALDFLAAMTTEDLGELPEMEGDDDDEFEDDFDDDYHQTDQELCEILGINWFISLFTPFTQWLNRNSASLGMLFSLLWFVDTFITAHLSRARATRVIDQKRLLSSCNSAEEEVQSSKVIHWFQTPRCVYYRRVVVQLLLLPVGFYIYSYSVLKSHRLQDVDEEEIRIVHHQQRNDNSSNNGSGDDQQQSDLVETFTMNAHLSLIVALVHSVIMEVSTRAKLRFATAYMRHVRIAVRKLAWRAIRHPRSFARKMKLGTYYFRWIKYLLPLVGAINKFQANAKDLFIKHKQKRQARRAKKIRKKLWHEMTEEEHLNHAAIVIQKQYRSYKSRQHMLALRLLQGHKERWAALRLQTQFRAAMYRARGRLARKHAELIQLQQREQELRKKKEMMDSEDRMQMYYLQHELEGKAKELLNKKLLLRPNTTFAVAWKTIFVVTVLFEISVKALSPLIKDQSVESFLQERLVPIPVADLPQCLPPEEPGAHWPAVLRPLSKVLFLGHAQSTIEEPVPWYCDDPYYEYFQAVYITLLEFLIHHFLIIVGFICYLDVFITFFTGRFDENNGRLVPKPFFERWISPGIIIQLLVNPQMVNTSRWVWQACIAIFHLGPIRCLRWTVALFFPLFLAAKKWVKREWHQLVDKQNQSVKYSIYTNVTDRRTSVAFRVSLPPDGARRMSTRCMEFRASKIVRQ